MEGLPPMETVYEAINTLYHNPDCNKKSEANCWLINLQKSIYAWKVADELLQRQTDVDSCYLGAQMIRNKIMFSFHELPQDAVLSLHSSLMQQLNKINNETYSVIVTQLCVAVVDLSLQMSCWKNPVHSFLNQYNDIPHIVLLEILRVFPEEIDTELMRLGSNRRNEIFNELCNCFDLLNNYLKQVILREPSSEILLKAFRCFSSWISIGFTNMPSTVECELLPKAFQILANPSEEMYERSTNIESKLHDAATEVICNFLKCLKGTENYSVLHIDLFTKSFENAYHTSVARESTDTSINYCRIYSELAGAYLPLMIDETHPGNPHYSLKTLDLVLTCTEHHNYEVCLITFNFWYLLSEMIYQRNDEDLTTEFKPYINRLLTALCRKVQLEPDHEGLLEEIDDFKSFRDTVSDLVKDVVFIVGSTHTFRQMFQNMQNSRSLTWDQIEANLFIMHAVAKNILPDTDDIVPQTVETIFQLNETTHVAVKYTAILLLGELCEWFDKHPNYLAEALKSLEFCLPQNELANAAAASMYSICHVAKVKLKFKFPQLLNILRNLHSLNLTNEAAIAVIKGVVEVMSYSSVEEIVALKEICWLQAEPLCELMKYQNTTETKGTNADPVFWLDRLAAVFKYIEPVSNDVLNSTAIVFSEQMQPVLFQVMDRFNNDVRIMERCCRCLRFAIRAVGKLGVFILEPLVQKLLIMYGSNRHSCFMYLGSVLVDEYGYDDANWGILFKIVNAFIEPTLSLLQNSTGFRDHPDTVDDLFRLSARILQRLPVTFLRSSSLWSLLECGLVAISLDHREANASVMKFFHEMFDFSNNEESISKINRREAVQPIYEKHGELIIHNLLHASVFVLPCSILSNIAEVIYDLSQFNKEVTIKWMNLSIQKLPNQTSTGGLIASNEQIQVFLNTCEKAVNVKEISRALKQFTNFYR